MRFRLSTLLLSTAVVATSMTPPAPLGIVLAGYSLVLVFAIRRAVAQPGVERGVVMGGVLGLGLLLSYILANESGGREYARWDACRNNLTRLACALEMYCDRWGSYPPPYLADKNGRPMHSWRVLILPYLEETDRWTAYRLDEPWDSPNNRHLATPLPSVFCCPVDNSAGPTATSYLMVTGPGTASETLAEHGAKNRPRPHRILLVEVANSGIDWMDPTDLTLDEARAGINLSNGRGISSLHTRGQRANVVLPLQGFVCRSAYCDDGLHWLTTTTTREELETFLTGEFGDLPESSHCEFRGIRLPPLDTIAWLASLAVLLVHGLIVDARDRNREAGETASPTTEAEPLATTVDVARQEP